MAIEKSLSRCPVAFSRVTAWFRFVPARRTSPAAAITSASASRSGDHALARAPRADASAASAANAPRASPDRSAARLTSSNSSSVSENWTTRGRDTACRDRRRTVPSPAAMTTPIPRRSSSPIGTAPGPQYLQLKLTTV